MAAVTSPSFDDLVARFSEFATADEGLVDLVIDDAARQVDDTWSEGDQQRAIIFLAAHYLAAGATQTTQTTEGGPGVKSETIGRISITYGNPASAADLTTTNYGNMYLDAFRRNRNRAIVI